MQKLYNTGNSLRVEFGKNYIKWAEKLRRKININFCLTGSALRNADSKYFYFIFFFRSVENEPSDPGFPSGTD